MSSDDDITKNNQSDQTNHDSGTSDKWQKILEEESSAEKELPLDEGHVPTGPIEETMSELKEDLATKTAEAEDYKERWMRSEANRKNQEMRMSKEIDKARKYGAERLINDMIQVIDSLKQGIESSQNHQENDAEVIQAMQEGMKLTHKMMLDILGKYGVKELNPIGEKYDPHVHEAITMQPDNTVETNTVLTVVQTGYQLHERVIRPARVIVSQKAG